MKKSSSSSATSCPASIRQYGQRSLSSLFSPHLENQGKKPSNSSVSLIDFLDKKIEQRSKKTLQDKQGSNSEVPIPRVIGDSNNEGRFKVPKSVFQQPEACWGNLQTNTSVSEISPIEKLNCLKRKSIESPGNSQRSSSSILILGDEPKPKRKFYSQRQKGERPPCIFNHYADGGGWWNDDMVGLASDEVGTTEVWEGMGSTTIGGL